ncbi:hypothetical protein V5O48_003715 [Marasmius crinis-equi]|uniref:Uncharacterized protein n=1 Tax=Marasmius crinis-equi TaxID=585013 RepID=A0ABR3FS34_9AGAR
MKVLNDIFTNRIDESEYFPISQTASFSQASSVPHSLPPYGPIIPDKAMNEVGSKPYTDEAYSSTSSMQASTNPAHRSCPCAAMIGAGYNFIGVAVRNQGYFTVWERPASAHDGYRETRYYTEGMYAPRDGASAFPMRPESEEGVEDHQWSAKPGNQFQPRRI